MDGTDDMSFVSNDIKWPNGLTIDYPNQRLYWVDAKLSTIESILLDGTDRRIILAGIVKHPYAIAVFENKLYWSDWYTHSIQSCDKFTGKNHHVLVREKKDYIYGVHIFHSALKQRSNNSCDGALCSDLCLLSGMSYSCACPQDKIMSADKHKCIEVEKKKILVIGAGDMLLTVHHQKLGKHQITALPFSFSEISSLCYNRLNGNVIVADKKEKKIYTVDLEKNEKKILVSTGIGEIGGMDFDYYSNNIYWCDTELKTVEILSLNTMMRKVILRDLKDEVPLDLALVPEEGIMFIAFQKPKHSAHIDRLHMDGQSSRTHVIEQGLIGPFVSLTYDSGLQRIFFSDSYTGNIDHTSIDGDDRHGFRTLLTEPISLTVLGNDLFWTNFKSRKLYWADKHNLEDSYTRKITLDLSENTQKMHLTTISGVQTISHPCLEDNGKCSHLCLHSGKESFCACPLGQILQADNKTCFAPKYCTTAEFKCESSDICIPKEMRCDGKKDCIMGDDEIDCVKQHHCPREYFECLNGQCIPERKVCDYHYDCKDNSDEMNCNDFNKESKCAIGQFQCGNNHCIPDRFVCDGLQDCNDGSDEIRCQSLTCSKYEFRCGTGNCIPKSWECDHEFDCPDQTDEHENCAPFTCAPGKFTCNNGRCLDPSLQCNDIDDCGDHSDENECQSTDPTFFTCEDDEFQCYLNSSLCIPETARCNGTSECPKGEDEKNCQICHSDEFECVNKKCIAKKWVCDNTDDCGDKSDEDPALCASNSTKSLPEFVDRQRVTIPCENGFRCKTGHCIDMKLVCNGHENCYDGSDEHGSCESSCVGHNNPCASICLKTPSGPKCACHEGYKLQQDSRTCEDIDECKSESAVCSHLCTNSEGSFICACYDGYLLRPDRKSCKAIGDPMSIIFSTSSEIRRLTPTQNTVDLLFNEDSPRITGLDVSIKENYLYFSMELMGSIYRISLKSQVEEYVLGIGQPQKLAIDWVTENIYFIDAKSRTKVIKACHLHEQKCAKILEVASHDQVSSLSIDAVNKFMFYSVTTWWLFNSPSSVIYKCNLDGSKIHELVKNDLGYVTGLTYDLNKKMLYFSDKHLHQIQAVDYDGNNRQIILEGSSVQHPIGLNIFEDFLYFLTPNGQITRCRIYGNTKNCISFKLHAHNVELFTIFQQSKQPEAKNICKEHNCTHLCVQSETTVICICEDGSKVDDGTICPVIEKSAPNLAGEKQPVFQISSKLSDAKDSSKASSVLAAIFVSVLLITIALGVYYYVHAKISKTGKLNISMRFRNPAYGIEPRTSISNDSIQPGQHEYINPVHINTQDLQTATDIILQRAKQNPFTIADSSQDDNYTNGKLIKL